MKNHTKNYKNSKCKTLESPRYLYNDLLLDISKKLGKDEKNVFQFWFRDDLPQSILEAQQPLDWFVSLEHHGKLSWSDVDSLCDFLEIAPRFDLVSQLLNYQAKVSIIEFFRKHLQQKLPELCLDNEFNKNWTSKEELPEHYSEKCNELFYRGQNCDIHCLLSKGILLMEDSCQPSHSSRNDVHSVALKLLHLANLFYNRFKEMVVDNQRLLNFEPLRDLECCCNDRQRTVVIHERRRSEVELVQQQISNRSCEVVRTQGTGDFVSAGRLVSVSWIFLLLGFSISLQLIGMFKTFQCK